MSFHRELHHAYLLKSERCDDAANRVSNDEREGMCHGAVCHFQHGGQSPMCIVNFYPVKTVVAVPARPIGVLFFAAEVHLFEQHATTAGSGTNWSTRHD